MAGVDCFKISQSLGPAHLLPQSRIGIKHWRHMGITSAPILIYHIYAYR